MYSQYGNCPHCNVSRDGGPIPEKIRQHYGPPYRWSNIIGISSLDLDRTIGYQCPNCKTGFKREEITREWQS